MYGYVTPDKPYLCFKDYALYRAFYCGTCIRVGKTYGQFPRLTTNYDATFLEILIFSYLGVRPAFKDRVCILNPIKKKPTVIADPLLDDLAAFNILLAYHNLQDDVIDGEGLKKMLPRSFLSRAYKRAKMRLPAVDAVITARYADLRAAEKANLTSVDRACDPFGRMMSEGIGAMLGEKSSENLEQFCYNLGRYIYLTDALDDLAKDAKSKSYNPFLAAYGEFCDRASYLTAHGKEMSAAIMISINRCIECYNALNLTEARNMLDNVVYRGLRRKADMIFAGVKNASKEKI